MSMISLRRSRHFTIIHMYMLSSGLSKHLRVMPSSFFGVSLFLVEGSRDFWHWFSGPFPYSISPSSSPYLHKPGFRRTTEIPKIHFKETVLPISQILAAHIHSEVAWPQLILTEVAIAGDIWSKYPSLGLGLMPWSFTSYFMRNHQSDQPDHLSDHWLVINLHQEASSCSKDAEQDKWSGFILWLWCQRLDLSIHSNSINLCDCKMPAGGIRCMTL